MMPDQSGGGGVESIGEMFQHSTQERDLAMLSNTCI